MAITVFFKRAIVKAGKRGIACSFPGGSPWEKGNYSARKACSKNLQEEYISLGRTPYSGPLLGPIFFLWTGGHPLLRDNERRASATTDGRGSYERLTGGKKIKLADNTLTRGPATRRKKQKEIRSGRQNKKPNSIRRATSDGRDGSSNKMGYPIWQTPMWPIQTPEELCGTGNL